MSATREHHIIYPSFGRIKRRLADAEASHLILYNSTEKRIDPFTWEFRASCTPTNSSGPYLIMVYWQTTKDHAHISCSCTAGTFGLLCKHGALTLQTFGLANRVTKVRVMNEAESQQYESLAVLPDWVPEWKESEDEQHPAE